MCFRVCVLLVVLLTSCKVDKENKKDNEVDYTWNMLKVTASAYNSLANQTNSSPNITAFGDSLKPGMKCIAVSRDLLALGLTYNTPVKIHGLEGLYTVKDKMNAHWKNHIDIYMGIDQKAAIKWGRKKVTIAYGVKNIELNPAIK